MLRRSKNTPDLTTLQKKYNNTDNNNNNKITTDITPYPKYRVLAVDIVYKLLFPYFLEAHLCCILIYYNVSLALLTKIIACIPITARRVSRYRVSRPVSFYDEKSFCIFTRQKSASTSIIDN